MFIFMSEVKMFWFCVVEMFVCHKASLTSETLPGNVQLACSGDVLSLPYARNAVAVWNLRDDSVKVFCLFCVQNFISLLYYVLNFLFFPMLLFIINSLVE